jgi:hypothetical protein
MLSDVLLIHFPHVLMPLLIGVSRFQTGPLLHTYIEEIRINFNVRWDQFVPVVPHKAVAEVSKIGNL